MIHTFDLADGAYPAASLVVDGAGNLYGVTSGGGAYGDGVAFELSPPAARKQAWKETVLHASDGNFWDGPTSGLIMDGAGNLYGTTGGGAEDDGQAYELSPPTQGEARWTRTVLRRFDEHLKDPEKGLYPQGGLIADAGGNLYGVTYRGGAYNYGVVFELSPPGAGAKHWKETVLHAFNGKHGGSPEAGLISDGAGGFYGTAPIGGLKEDGVVFELAP